MSKILITGATGHLGTAAAEQLLKKARAGSVYVLARSEEKAAALKARGAEVVIGDYNNYDSLVAAFKGIDKVYLISGNELEIRSEQQARIIDAAKAAGVKHIVYTSFQRKNESADSAIWLVAQSHLDTENRLKASGLTYTILKHGLYSDIIPGFSGEKLLETKTLYFPAGEGKTAFAVRTDFAEAGANVLFDQTGKYDNKSLTFTGAEAVSWSRIAALISEQAGVHITYVSPSQEEYKSTLLKAGVPEIYVNMFAGFGEGMKQGEFDMVYNDLETVLGRKPVAVAEYLKSVYSKKAELV